MFAFRLTRLRMPAAWQWDHNAHYHDWLLDQIPAGAQRALDVGCGRGALARKLAEHVKCVDAVDRSPAMIIAASRRPDGGNTTVNWRQADLLDPGNLAELLGGYDLVTVLSALHHLPLEPALGRLADLVAPGGVLAVIGLYRAASFPDYAIGALAILANPLVGAWRAARGRAGKPEDIHMPVQDPTRTIAEIRAAARTLLPGARIRRRLFFRYSLRWERSSTDMVAST